MPPYEPVAVLNPEPQESLSVSGKGPVTVAGRRLQAELGTSSFRLDFSHKNGGLAAPDVRVGFRDGYLMMGAALRPGEHLYGLGEKTGWLDKKGRRYRMCNTDVWLQNPAGIGFATDPLYASFPVFIVHGVGGSYGVFLDNAEFAEFDFSRESRYEIAVPTEVLNCYFLPGPALPAILRRYTGLTGRISLPPLWSLGYHQCRWSYADEEQVRQVGAELRSRSLPADAVWLDIDYMSGCRVFTRDNKRFPHFRELVDGLLSEGFHSVTILDPGIKVEQGYTVYEEGRSNNHFIKHPDGREYRGLVWAGPSAFPDFHRRQTRRWWARLVRHWLAETGVSGLWLDMNEPSATDLSGPLHEVHHGAGKLPHAAARNTYALQMARSTWEGMLEQAPSRRPFILTRAAFSGTQEVAALWGGDNSSCWEHLAASLPLLMNLGLSGMPFAGVDIGGFSGDCSAELLVRWTQVGALYPFCRNHSARDTRNQEPWTFGPEVEAICRTYLELRYRLLPYIYNLFYQAAQTGAPVLRPLVWHYPKDPFTFNLNDQFMLGPCLLVAPILSPGLRARAVYLPRGRWYRWGDRRHAGLKGPRHLVAEAPLHELPIFVPAGALIPMWPLAQHTGAIARGEVSIHIWPGRGQLDYYEDDGISRTYVRGERRLTLFRLRRQEDCLELTWGRPRGKYQPGRSHWRFVFHGIPEGKATLDGRPVECRRQAGGLAVKVRDDGEGHRLRLEQGAPYCSSSVL